MIRMGFKSVGKDSVIVVYLSAEIENDGDILSLPNTSSWHSVLLLS
jgi:hypothetical protein